MRDERPLAQDAAMLQVGHLDVLAGPHLPILAHGVQFKLGRGERLGLIGRNGAGKSTLLRQLGGLLPLAGADAEVMLDGHSWHSVDVETFARLRALMPSQTRDRFNLPVLALLELAQPRLDLPSAREALLSVDAWALRDRNLLSLSAGERQRVALAQALVQGGPLLLLDEPVAFQDPGHQRLVGRLMETLKDRIVVFCAHDINWVAQHATHVLGLGLRREPQDWFFDPTEQALQPQRLHDLYDCDWTLLRDAGGRSAWFTP